ncbi:MAG TPA: hypothetical protein VHY20_07405, partial [Pirellulales bacterium]|nr:hypothetical protein [Pirellulales bacterium]
MPSTGQRRADPQRCKGSACLDDWTVQAVAANAAAGQFMAGSDLASAQRSTTAAGEGDVEACQRRLRQRLSAILGIEPSGVEVQSAAAEASQTPAGQPPRRKRGRPRKPVAAKVQPQYMNLWR